MRTQPKREMMILKGSMKTGMRDGRTKDEGEGGSGKEALKKRLNLVADCALVLKPQNKLVKVK